MNRKLYPSVDVHFGDSNSPSPWLYTSTPPHAECMQIIIIISWPTSQSLVWRVRIHHRLVVWGLYPTVSFSNQGRIKWEELLSFNPLRVGGANNDYRRMASKWLGIEGIKITKWVYWWWMRIFESKIEFPVNFVRHHHPPVSVQAAIGSVVTNRTRYTRTELNCGSVNRNGNDREVNILFQGLCSCRAQRGECTVGGQL